MTAHPLFHYQTDNDATLTLNAATYSPNAFTAFRGESSQRIPGFRAEVCEGFADRVHGMVGVGNVAESAGGVDGPDARAVEIEVLDDEGVPGWAGVQAVGLDACPIPRASAHGPRGRSGSCRPALVAAAALSAD
ncbi:hypothetical protein [Streptomyces fagopyri]